MKPIFYYILSAALLVGSAYYHATRYEAAHDVYYEISRIMQYMVAMNQKAIAMDINSIDEHIRYELLEDKHSKSTSAQPLKTISLWCKTIDSLIQYENTSTMKLLQEQEPDSEYPERPLHKVLNDKALKIVHDSLLQNLDRTLKHGKLIQINLSSLLDSTYEVHFAQACQHFARFDKHQQRFWLTVEQNYIHLLHRKIISKIQENILHEPKATHRYALDFKPIHTEQPFLKINIPQKIFVQPVALIQSIEHCKSQYYFGSWDEKKPILHQPFIYQPKSKEEDIEFWGLINDTLSQTTKSAYCHIKFRAYQ